MISQFPALQVVIPLIGAPLCIILRRGALPWLVALLVSWVALAMAATLLSQVADGSVISYALGGWLAPLGIEYRVDVLNAFMMLLVAGTSSIVLPFAYKSVAKEIPEDRHYLFYSGFLLMLTGLLGMAITGDAFNVFVFIEISSLSSYAMIAMGRDRRALSAAFTYLVMGTVGATFFLIGVGLIYAVTGTLNMADLAERLPPIHESRTVLAAFAFISVGILLKLALFPLHLWLPNAYTYAPSVVTAFLAATATKVALYLLLRFAYTVFGADFVFNIVPVLRSTVSLSACRNRGGLDGGDLPERCKTTAGLFERRAGRLHHSWDQLRQRDRPDGVDRSHLQSCRDEGRVVLGDGLYRLCRRRLPPGELCGPWETDATDHGGLRDRRAELDRRAVDGGLCQQVVPGAGRDGKRLVAGCRGHPGDLLIGGGLCLARGGDRLFPRPPNGRPAAERPTAGPPGADVDFDRGVRLLRD